MKFLDYLSIKAKNLKCFGEEPQGFESIKAFNVIIGRNNTGKTTLLDLIEFVKSRTADPAMGHNGSRPNAILALDFDGGIKPELVPEDPFLAEHLALLNTGFQESQVSWTFDVQGKPEVVHLKVKDEHNFDQLRDVVNHALKRVLEGYSKLNFVRLAADRDIRVEVDDNPLGQICESDFTASGEGATRVLQRMLNNNDSEHRKIVEGVILPALNLIYEPDGNFTRMFVLRQSGKQASKEYWEIHLENGNGLTIPMSRMGSGVKTILLVLTCLFVVPRVIHKQPLSNFMFGFEELENNLHPAIQKRLFRFLRDTSEREKCRFFVTTHSHVVIDLFSQDSKAQIVHVTHEREKDIRVVETVIDSKHHGRVFDDLDVRASDLLQANCVIWVEGPSDVIYLNTWIGLVAPELQFHVDYEFAFTSGTLLAHQSFDPKKGNLIQAIRINRNAIILMDRDKKDGELKPWVERVLEEVPGRNGLAWVTAGKEIENYIPIEVLRAFLKKPELIAPSTEENMFNFIAANGGLKYENRKVELATAIGKLTDRSMLKGALDLEDKVVEVCRLIRFWNRRPAK